MASVDLRLLRYFLAVAEESHLTKAAARLGIRQPPLSQQIRVLEQELGVTLFHRLPRGMELTESGRALVDDARNIIALVDQAVDGGAPRLARRSRPVDGWLHRIGGVPSLRADGHSAIPRKARPTFGWCLRKAALANCAKPSAKAG